MIFTASKHALRNLTGGCHLVAIMASECAELALFPNVNLAFLAREQPVDYGLVAR
jgi:hypothetical protein